ncbi:MAG: NAD(P)-dependent glycerol-3-phosphate dehydrogenase [Gammaproteobacteria bacterium]|nr:NAD(P)-dependent glycerol-3-phosphate dehydrogenase [Gammaproteobacteria bacterium]
MAVRSPVSIAVLGAGSWGTALAILLSRNGADVKLWSHLQAHAAALQRERQNQAFLPGHEFPLALTATADLASALTSVDEILIAVPSHAFASVLEETGALISPGSTLSWATKGLLPGTGELLHEFVERIENIASTAVISGPSFAAEVARGLPTALTVASRSSEHATRLANYLHSDNFRAYTSSDVIGLEVCGAAKNIMAIAAGIADGLGFGANTRAALITRGLAEIMRLGLALGGVAETFMGLGGLGDLVLTCTDDQSRNRRMGLALARGLSIEQARQEIGQEVEGIPTTQEIRQKAVSLGVEMPITEQTYRVLYQGLSPRAAVHSLLGRSQKRETG